MKMNYRNEAKEILKASIKDDSELTAKALLMSLIEFSNCSGVTYQDLKQMMQDIWDELDCPEEAIDYRKENEYWEKQSEQQCHEGSFHELND